MPTYLCHGFRWHRRDIRIFVILNNMDDAAPDWIIGRTTSSLLLSRFAESFDFLPGPRPPARREPLDPLQVKLHRDDDLTVPASRVPASDDDVLVNDWSPVKLLEEYDADETESAARPYAFVADHVVRVDLDANVGDEMAEYEALAREHDTLWFEKLRDEIQAGETIGWHVVVCADPERRAPGSDGADDLAPHDSCDGRAASASPSSASRGGLALRRALPTGPETATSPHASRSGRCLTAGSKARHVPRAKQDGSQAPPGFLGQDTSKAGAHQPGLRHKLSAKGLRRLFSKRDG